MVVGGRSSTAGFFSHLAFSAFSRDQQHASGLIETA
jgi:hypothetical protein